MGFCNQLKALLKKNLIMWQRNVIGSLCEICFPLLMISVIVIVRQIIPGDSFPMQSYLEGSMTQPYYVDYDLKYNVTTSFNGVIRSANPFSSCVQFKRFIFAYVGDNRLYPLIRDKLEKVCSPENISAPHQAQLKA